MRHLLNTSSLVVVIMHGRHKGRLARVVSSGSGWVLLKLADEDGTEPDDASFFFPQHFFSGIFADNQSLL